MIDGSKRLGGEILKLIDLGQYFLIHAGRQTGKTTLLLSLTREINQKGDYYALYCSLETISTISSAKEGIPAIVKKIRSAISNLNFPVGFAEGADYDDSSNVLIDSLSRYCRNLDKPLAVFFDEADSLSNETLISFLRQLRDGYNSRALAKFVHSVVLVGLRSLRDYKAYVRPDGESKGLNSPFNIVTKSLVLRTFNKEEIAELYGQHTQATGQVFEQEAIDLVWEQTSGQPWLVNAIAREIVMEQLNSDYSKKVDAMEVKEAVQTLIKRRDVHFDSLIEKLKEPRVRRVIEPMLLGEKGEAIRDSDDYQFVKDLGIIRDDNGKIEPANQMYAEMIARALSWNAQTDLLSEKEYDMPKFIKNGKMDINYLLKDFQDFWRKNSEIFKERYSFQIYDYVEAAPHLVLQAFLQRVINGGGDIHREFAAGSGMADLLVEYEGYEYPIELKIFYDNSSVNEGLEQISKYVERCKCEEGWLVLFDRSIEKSWDEKIYMREEVVSGKKITVIGC